MSEPTWNVIIRYRWRLWWLVMSRSDSPLFDTFGVHLTRRGAFDHASRVVIRSMRGKPL